MIVTDNWLRGKGKKGALNDSRYTYPTQVRELGETACSEGDKISSI